MRLAVADAMRARLAAADALTVWAETWGQTVPEILIGYRRPRTAQGWPFVAIVPVRDHRDLIEGKLDALVIGLVCGVRAQDSDQSGALGLRAVDALSDACIAILSTPRTYTAGTRQLVTDYADLTDIGLEHPNYELELALDLRVVGASR